MRMPFCCGTFLCECYGCFNQPQMKTNDPVGTLLDIYDIFILKIDSLLSLTSLFDLEYIFWKFSCEYPGPAVSFWARELKVIANAATWTLVLDIMEQNNDLFWYQDSLHYILMKDRQR